MNAQFFEKTIRIRVQEKYAIPVRSESGERGVLPRNSQWLGKMSNDNTYVVIADKGDANIALNLLHEHWDELRVEIDLFDPATNSWKAIDDWNRILHHRCL